jgi:hypothetical protein
MKFMIPFAAAVLAVSADGAAGQDTPPVVEDTMASPAADTVNALAARLRDAFVDPDAGMRYAAMLESNLAQGTYEGLSGEALAKRLTRDLQSVQADGHLRLRALTSSEVSQAELLDIPPPTAAALPNLEHAGWIAPGIAFARFNLFPYEEADIAAVARFMADHAEARALIFDLRTHRGGGLAQIDAIFSWLHAEPQRLVSMAMRRSVEEAMMREAGIDPDGPPPPGPPSLKFTPGTPQEAIREHWSTPNGDPRLNDARVYLLTSPRTGSAAEHFAFAMKLSGRGTIIGSATDGANHFGGEEPLPGGLVVFVPFGRTFDPATGADWEGVGVQPDIAAPPEDALIVALAREGVALPQAKSLSDSVRPTGSMERRGNSAP